MLGDEFLTRPRLSRIYYNGQYFAYPLTAKDVLGRLGLWESTRCALSYLWSMRHRRREAETFEEWVTNRFGRRLYDAFFRTYTQKVWGIPGSEIRALWAAQRIKNFSLVKAVLTFLGLRRDHVTTLIEEFRYPRLGPGQMWEAFQERLEAGLPVQLERRCSSIRHDGTESRASSSAERPRRGACRRRCRLEHRAAGSRLSLDPPAPPEIQAAARRLRYRDLCLVALMTSEEQPFEDNWIYLHDPETRAGRVQNYGAWSEAMVRPGRPVSASSTSASRATRSGDAGRRGGRARDERARGDRPDRPEQGLRRRQGPRPQGLPDVRPELRGGRRGVRGYLAGFYNLETCGRNGLHRYNNQDHSMWTAVLATLNLLDGTETTSGRSTPRRSTTRRGKRSMPR